MSAIAKQSQDGTKDRTNAESIRKLIETTEAICKVQEVEAIMRKVARRVSEADIEAASAGIAEAIKNKDGMKRSKLFERGVKYMRNVLQSNEPITRGYQLAAIAAPDAVCVIDADEMRTARDEAVSLGHHVSALQSLACGGESVEVNGAELYSLLESIRRQAEDIQNILT